MKALRRTDRHNTDRTELKLIRVGHALWAILKRDRARNGGYLPQTDPIWTALATVWKLKKRLSGRTGCQAAGGEHRVAGEVRY
jgi:hypothetical protein